MPTSLSKIEQIEQRHGFVFGLPDDHDSDHAPVLKTVKCETAGCERAHPRAAAMQIHADTAQPVTCGGCHAVLHCDHVTGDPVDTIGGTLGEPTSTSVRSCVKCGTEVSRETRTLKPVRFRDLPAEALAALGVVFQPDDGA